MRLYSYLFSIMLLTSCIGIRDRVLPATWDCKISLKAINLSEDRSNFSSKNDEILFLLYEFENGKPSQLLQQVHKVFDLNNKQTDTSFITTIKSSTDSITLVMIEIDENILDPSYPKIIQKHYSILKKALDGMDLKTIKKYIKDDDLLYLKTMRISEINKKFKIAGVDKLDKFEYQISSKCR